MNRTTDKRTIIAPLSIPAEASFFLMTGPLWSHLDPEGYGQLAEQFKSMSKWDSKPARNDIETLYEHDIADAYSASISAQASYLNSPHFVTNPEQRALWKLGRDVYQRVTELEVSSSFDQPKSLLEVANDFDNSSYNKPDAVLAETLASVLGTHATVDVMHKLESAANDLRIVATHLLHDAMHNSWMLAPTNPAAELQRKTYATLDRGEDLPMEHPERFAEVVENFKNGCKRLMPNDKHVSEFQEYMGEFPGYAEFNCAVQQMFPNQLHAAQIVGLTETFRTIGVLQGRASIVEEILVKLRASHKNSPHKLTTEEHEKQRAALRVKSLRNISQDFEEQGKANAEEINLDAQYLSHMARINAKRLANYIHWTGDDQHEDAEGKYAGERRRLISAGLTTKDEARRLLESTSVKKPADGGESVKILDLKQLCRLARYAGVSPQLLLMTPDSLNQAVLLGKKALKKREGVITGYEERVGFLRKCNAFDLSEKDLQWLDLVMRFYPLEKIERETEARQLFSDEDDKGG